MEYKTSNGDTWDIIAIKFYGDEYKMHILMEANPKYRKYHLLPENLTINIPAIEEEALKDERLPIWKKK